MNQPGPPRSVVLLGATGLIGAHLLDALQADPTVERIVTLTRRDLPAERLTARTENHVVDFDDLPSHAELFAVQQLFLCLGTTRSEAGKKGFYKVDFTYTAQAAEIASEQRVADVYLVSSVGANPASMSYYLKVKGHAEVAVQALPFRSVTIARPTLLLGDRDKPRFGEQLVAGAYKRFPFLFAGPLEGQRPVAAAAVARALAKVATRPSEGFNILEADELRRLGAP